MDLSSQDNRTARCLVDWGKGQARVLELSLNTSDEQINQLIQTTDKVGIDVPFGWPTAFVEAVAQHNRDGSWPTAHAHSNTRDVRYRRTDLSIWRMNGVPPLSVSTDKIALPAMRAAALLSRLSQPVPRDGSGIVVEVYPAATLKRWGFRSRGYKGPDNADAREDLFSAFRSDTASWLNISDDQVELCASSDDAFDGLICALVARASAKSLCEPIDDDDREAAQHEGWIGLPREGSLRLLARD